MTVLTALLPASFRGVGFYCLDSSMDSGRKQVTHEFPNSDRRYVEDLGRFQNVYKMQAMITGNASSYIRNRNALISALQQPGIGLLVHPFYGPVQVVPKQFTVQENFIHVGEAVFSLTFEKAQQALVPQGDSTNLGQIFRLAGIVLSLLSGNIASVFSQLGGYPNNFTDAQNVIGAIANAFGSNTQRFTQDLGAINGFSSLLGDYRGSTNAMILDPTLLGSNTMGLFDGVNSLISSPSDLFNVLGGFYDFYNGVSAVPPTTFERIQRQQNRSILQIAIQAGALSQAYQAAAQVPYTNINELNAAQTTLETQYQAVIDTPNLSNETKLALQDLRNQMRLFFEAKRLNVNQITTINTPLLPLTVLAYQYYGNTNNVQALNDLNQIRNNAFIEGLIEILTS